MTELRGCPGSPNYCWLKAGYQIRRERRENKHGFIRHIYDSDGAHVMSGGSHEEEMIEIRKREIYQI